jgi:hypothetical protein
MTERGRVLGIALGMMIKPSSLREELVVSLRIIVSIAASIIVGIACIAIISTDALAKAAAGLTRINPNHVHHGSTVHRSGQVRHPRTPAATTTTGMGTGKP